MLNGKRALPLAFRGKPSAAALAQRLAELLPGFQDNAACSEGQQEVVLLRKAQGLAAALFLRFAESDKRFKFCDIHRLSADSGAATPLTALLPCPPTSCCGPLPAAVLDDGVSFTDYADIQTDATPPPAYVASRP